MLFGSVDPKCEGSPIRGVRSLAENSCAETLDPKPQNFESQGAVSCRELMRSFGWDTADAFMQHDAQASGFITWGFQQKLGRFVAALICISIYCGLYCRP